MTNEIKKKWEKFLPSEVSYWAGLFQQNSYDPSHIEAFMNRIENEPIFQFEKDLLDPPGTTIKVLDVGAGPLTHIGSLNSKYNIEITAIDPLAMQYLELWNKFGKKPRVKTVYGEAEKISESFKPASFDIAFSRNALDHSYDPITAIKQMVCVSRRFVFIQGHVNEGESANYTGLHSWNFEPTIEDDLIIWNPTAKYSLKEELTGLAKVKAFGAKWFTCRITPIQIAKS